MVVYSESVREMFKKENKPTICDHILQHRLRLKDAFLGKWLP